MALFSPCAKDMASRSGNSGLAAEIAAWLFRGARVYLLLKILPQAYVLPSLIIPSTL